MFLVRRLIAVLVLAVFLVPGVAQADSGAQAVIRNFYTQLAATMKQGDRLGFDGRVKKLEPAVKSAFNLPLMTKLSVGSSWTDASAQEQADLIAAFSSFSVANYASRFTNYNGEQFIVIGEKASGSDVIVETSLKPKDADAVNLNYLMRKDDKGSYRIVDVMLNGVISEMATRRAEFSSIARRDGIQGLVNSLGEKSKQMGAS